VNSTSQSQGLLFGLEPPVPLGLSLDMPQQDTVGREAAQTAFVDYINKNAKAVPLLVARFIARQVANETLKLMPNASGTQTPSDIPEAESGGYTMYDHLERLRYLEVKAPEEEIKIVSKVLSSALPGLEQFVTEERHATLLGKMAYNSYGVCFGDGRDDRVYLHHEIMHKIAHPQTVAFIHRTTRRHRKDTDTIWNFETNRQWSISRFSICMSLLVR
jgi:import receptor subunit TOM20